MPSRFELLEIDDSPGGARRPCKGCGISTHLDVNDLCKACGDRAQHEINLGALKRREEIQHAQDLARIERERVEVNERRRASALAATDKRRARAKARRTGLSAKNQVNDKLYDLGLKKWPTVSEAWEAVSRAAREVGFEDTGEISHESVINGNHHVVHVVEDAEGKQYGLSFSTYRYQSGMYELTSYLS